MCKMICFQVTLSDPHALPVRHRYFDKYNGHIHSVTEVTIRLQ